MFSGWRTNDAGVTYNAQMEQARQTAEKFGLDWEPPDPVQAEEQPEPPFGFDFLWETFLELSSGRQCGFGMNPISWQDMKAWSELHGIQLHHWEMQTIRQLDALAMKILGERKKSDA